MTAVAAILDPARQRLYDIVRGSDHAVGVDEAALAAGIPRTTAALHLDKLVRAGVLEVELRRRHGRTGPGAGRPAKLYRASGNDDVVGVAERDYELIGDILATGIEDSAAHGTPVVDSVASAARRRGAQLGRGADLETALVAAGYQPRAGESGAIALANCLFHSLAADHTALVCAANVALLEGLVEETDADGLRVQRVEPSAGCCAILTRA